VPPLPVVALLVPALLVTALWTRGVTGRPLESVATTLLGLWYTGGMLSFAYALRHHRFAIGAAAGTALVMFPMLVTWVTDAAAFVVGRAVGGPKLMPSVARGRRSPAPSVGSSAARSPPGRTRRMCSPPRRGWG